MLNFIQGLFSDEGKPDIGPVCSLLTTLATIGWVSYAIIKSPTHSIPDLNGPAFFMSVGAVGHYGLNKVNDVVQAFKSGPKV